MGATYLAIAAEHSLALEIGKKILPSNRLLMKAEQWNIPRRGTRNNGKKGC
jgi:hypothetical protein